MSRTLCLLSLLSIALGCSKRSIPEFRRPLEPGYLGIALAIPMADAKRLDGAQRAAVSASCPGGGVDPARQELIVPFQGVRIGSLSASRDSAALELHFPYGYDGLYTVLMQKACRDLRVTPSSAAEPGPVGGVPIMAVLLRKPEELGPGPLAPREGTIAEAFPVHESQVRFLRPGDDVDVYFACERWPKYMKPDRKKEWMSAKPVNAARVLDVSGPVATLEVDSPSLAALLRGMARDCTLSLARRAPGDYSSAGMTGVTLTSFGFSDRWRHWAK